MLLVVASAAPQAVVARTAVKIVLDRVRSRICTADQHVAAAMALDHVKAGATIEGIGQITAVELVAAVRASEIYRDRAEAGVKLHIAEGSAEGFGPGQVGCGIGAELDGVLGGISQALRQLDRDGGPGKGHGGIADQGHRHPWLVAGTDRDRRVRCQLDGLAEGEHQRLVRPLAAARLLDEEQDVRVGGAVRHRSSQAAEVRAGERGHGWARS